jgi:hypothetical protein
MKTILVPYLIFSALMPEMTEVSKALDKLGQGYAIDQVNWPGYDYQPKVRFQYRLRRQRNLYQVLRP